MKMSVAFVLRNFDDSIYECWNLEQFLMKALPKTILELYTKMEMVLKKIFTLQKYIFDRLGEVYAF